MPHVKHAFAFVAFALALVSARRASCEERQPSALSKRTPWEVSARAGYAAAFSTGVSYLGFGEGISAAYAWKGGPTVELGFTRYAGARVSASNASITYFADYTSTLATLGAGYDLAMGAFVVRPALRTGVAFIDGKTRVGSAEEHDHAAPWMVGPALSVFVRVWMFDVGADGEAYFVPTRVASPSLGATALAGMHF